MLVQLILVLISLCIFAAYNTVSLHKFGVPTSLSNTFYLYEGEKKHLGYIFTGMMFLMSLTLLPPWLELGEVISSWSKYLNSLVFFACASICFVGAAPAFRSCPLESTVHNVAAKLAAAFS